MGRSGRLLTALLGGVIVTTPLAAANFLVDTTVVDLGDRLPGDGKCEWTTPALAAKRCTLRAAVQEANALGGSDVIVIPAGWNIVLSRSGRGENDANTGDLDITDSVTIGSLAGPETWPIIDGNRQDRVFDVHGPATLTLQAVQVTGGLADTSAPLVDGYGGAVWVRGIAGLNLSQCRLAGNKASLGGAVASLGTATIESCTIEGNEVAGSLTRGSGVYGFGSLLIRESTISGNRDLGDSPILYAGVEVGGGSFILQNSTVTGSNGVGIRAVFTDVVLENVTIYDNQGIGLSYHKEDSFLSPLVRNSILSSCDITSNLPAVQGGRNLDLYGGCGLSEALGDLPGTNPQLGPLLNNGGTTRTFVPNPGSPVIDAGNVCLAGDQRGAPRPLDGDGVGGPVCDIGAVEVLPCVGADEAFVSTTTPLTTAFAVEVCYWISVVSPTVVANGGDLKLRTRIAVTFRNGLAVQAGGKMTVVLDPAAGSGMTLPGLQPGAVDGTSPGG